YVKGGPQDPRYQEAKARIAEIDYQITSEISAMNILLSNPKWDKDARKMIIRDYLSKIIGLLYRRALINDSLQPIPLPEQVAAVVGQYRIPPMVPGMVLGICPQKTDTGPSMSALTPEQSRLGRIAYLIQEINHLSWKVKVAGQDADWKKLT